jgi:23S rRNA pseudouridine1911/1915/1917 synthase
MPVKTKLPMLKSSIDIIEDTPDYIVINKPAGMLSIPDRMQSEPSLKDYLLQKFGEIFTVHRLDKETSGIIVFAKNAVTHKYLSGLFEGRAVQKQYQGLVLGVPYNKTGSIDAPLMEHPVEKGTIIVHQKGKPALTDYEVLQSFKLYSLVQFKIHTGRTHQIRVHAKNIGHPLACDPLYGDGKPVLLSSFKKKFKLAKDILEEKPMLARVALHSYLLQFVNQLGQTVTYEAAMPKDMRALITQLSKRLS